MATLAKLRDFSAAAHRTDTNMRHRRRYEDAAAADCVIFCNYDLPGPGVTGGLLRLGHGVERIGAALRRITEDREDESMPLGDKVLVAIDVVVGVTNIVVGACDFVIGACDLAHYTRGALARFRGKYLTGGSVEDRTTTRYYTVIQIIRTLLSLSVYNCLVAIKLFFFFYQKMPPNFLTPRIASNQFVEPLL